MSNKFEETAGCSISFREWLQEAVSVQHLSWTLSDFKKMTIKTPNYATAVFYTAHLAYLVDFDILTAVDEPYESQRIAECVLRDNEKRKTHPNNVYRMSQWGQTALEKYFKSPKTKGNSLPFLDELRLNPSAPRLGKAEILAWFESLRGKRLEDLE